MGRKYSVEDIEKMLGGKTENSGTATKQIPAREKYTENTVVEMLGQTTGVSNMTASTTSAPHSLSGLDAEVIKSKTYKQPTTEEEMSLKGKLKNAAKMVFETILGDEQGNTWLTHIMNPALLDGGTAEKPAFDMSTENQTVEYTPEGLPYLAEKKEPKNGNKGIEALLKNALYSFPGAKAVVKGVDKYIDPLLGTNLADSQGMKQEVQNLQEENKVASTVGALGGNLAGYYVGGQLVNAWAPLANMTGQAANTAANTLTGGKLSAQAVQAGAKPLQNIIADSSLDVALDVLPELGVMAGQGATGGEIAKQALGKTAENVALNTVGEAIPMVYKAIVGDKNTQSIIAKEKELSARSAKERLSKVYEKAMENNGQLGVEYKYNQETLLKVPSDVAEMINKASGGTLDVSGKDFAVEGGTLFHEISRHSDEAVELSRGQYTLTKEDLEKAIDAMVDPDIVENISTGLASEQRKTFALVKRDKGYIVLVEAVGGKQNPHIVPTQILNVSPEKMSSYLDDGKSIADMVYENSKRKGTVQDNILDIKNRVTAAPSAKVGLTADTAPHSPLSIDSVPTNAENVKIPYLGDGVNFGGKVLEESHSKNIGKGRVNNVDENVQNAFIDNPNLYTQLSNADTVAKAQQIYDSGNARSEIYRMLDKKDPAAIPLGNKIVGDLIDEGKKDEAVELLRTMSTKLRQSGQFSQAAAIIMLKSDPETALRYVVRNIDDMNVAGKKKFGNKWKDFELTDAEAGMFRSIKFGDTEAIRQAFEQVGARLSKEYPVTAWEKMVELSRVGMLLNPRTNIRNIISNWMLQPVRSLTDRVSALGQNAIHLFNPDFKVTQSLTGGGRKEKQIATEVWNSVKDSLLDNTSRYEDIKGAIKDKQVFKGSAVSKVFDAIFPGAIERANKAMGKNVYDSLLETARNFTYYILEKGDEPFVKNNFVNRLASYMKAQGIKNIDEIPEDAIMLAKDEALKATFKDDNNFTNMLSSIKKNLGKGGEVIMPFTKTPANLAMRGVDYSPAGIVNTIKKARSGADVGRIMDDLSKNITGTAAIALGYYLTKEGVITGALSSDKDEAAFQKQQGQLAYSIKVGDNYFNYDWAQPAAIPFILGASIAQSIEESDNEEKTALEKIESVANIAQQATTSAADAWVELSPLQTVSDIFNTGYGGSVPENVINELLEFPQRFIPSALGAAARTADTTQRQTYSAGNPIRTQVDTAKSKIPFLSETLPAAYDTWGREIKRSDSTGEAAFAQMLNPGTLGNNVSTPIDGEIQRLYEATEDKAVFPRKSEWKVNGEQLTNKEYSELQKEQGSLSYEMIETFMNSDSYSELSDYTKAKTIADMYSLTKALAENSVMDKPISDDYVKYADAYNTYGADGVVQFATLNATADTDKNEYLSQAEVESVLDATNLSRLQKSYYWHLVNAGWKNCKYD